MFNVNNFRTICPKKRKVLDALPDVKDVQWFALTFELGRYVGDDNYVLEFAFHDGTEAEYHFTDIQILADYEVKMNRYIMGFDDP